MIHYRVCTIINIINKSGKKIENDYVKLFSDNQPINARLAALKYAKSFLEILSDAKKETKSELATRLGSESFKKGFIFYDYSIEWYTEKDLKDIEELSDDFGYPSPEIGGFALNFIESTHFGPDFDSLEEELRLYKKNGYSTNGLETIYNFYNEYTSKTTKYQIIETPFLYDYACEIESEIIDEYYKPLSEISSTEENQIEDISEDEQQFISKILSIGETKTTEYKSTLSYCLKTKQKSKDVEYAVIKTINAFMNCEGGILLIGVNDNKEIIGLDNDYSLYKSPNPKDELLKKLDNLVINYLGKPSLSFISGKFYNFGSKDILSINVKRSPEPVFIKSIKPNTAFDFCIRGNASSVSLNIKEAFNHIIQHWKYKKKGSK